MKKTYQKPEIMFENFAASTNIAATCEVKTWTPNSGNCGFPIEDEFLGTKVLFTSEMVDVCKVTEAEGPYNGLCYDVPNEAFNLFNS